MQTLTHNIMKQPEAITNNGCGSTEAYPEWCEGLF